MKKQLFLQLLLVAFTGLVYAQTGSEKSSPLKPKLNPNTDSRNQQTPNAPAPATTHAPAGPRSNPGVSSGNQGKPNTSAARKESQSAQEVTPAPVPTTSKVKPEPVATPPQTTATAEKPATESPAAAAKRQLIADGYKVCMTHPDYGKVYCKDAADTGSKPTKSQRGSGQTTTYFYIDEDGIATPLDRKLVVGEPDGKVKTKDQADAQKPANPDPVVVIPEQPKTGFRVIEAFSMGPQYIQNGPCPQKISFRARISVAGGSGNVSYKWLYSDGGSLPVQTLYFEGPGSKDIETDWTLGTPGTSYSGWVQLQIYDPTEIQAAKANFTTNCH